MSMLANSTPFVYPTASPDTLGVDHSFLFLLVSKNILREVIKFWKRMLKKFTGLKQGMHAPDNCKKIFFDK